MAATIFFFAILLLSVAASPNPLFGEAVSVPGDVDRICNYTNFFYPYPNNDFIYYLNDRMLFSEPPDGTIDDNRLRITLLGLVVNHNLLRTAMSQIPKDDQGKISLALDDESQFNLAVPILKLLNRELKKKGTGKISLNPLPVQYSDYLRFCYLPTKTIRQQMERTGHFYFHLKESQVDFPLDLAMIKAITGIPVTKENFLEHLIKNERLSLLVGTLYRLSDAEVRYVGQLDTSIPYGGWKKIYDDPKWLMGMFVLSSALRVEADKTGKPGAQKLSLILPGGPKSSAFWRTLATGDGGAGSKEGVGEDDAGQKSNAETVDTGSLEFLHRIATDDHGKLNYLYSFSFFLPDRIREPLFSGYHADAFKEIYDAIELDDREKISDTQFPVLRDWNFYTLLYSFREKEGKLWFPGGIDIWRDAVGQGEGNLSSPTNNEGDFQAKINSVLLELLREEAATKHPRVSPLRRFMAIYTKFFHSPALLNRETLKRLYDGYKDFNGLVDFMEKLPLKKPETVMQLFRLADKIETLDNDDKKLFSVMYQALFEILSFTARYAPEQWDYDLLVTKLTELPLERWKFYPQLLQFFHSQLGVREGGKDLLTVMLTGIKDRTVTIKGMKYRYMANRLLRDSLNAIMESQDNWRLSNFLELNRLVTNGIKLKPPDSSSVATRIAAIFRHLPHPEIDKKAPKDVKERVIPYSRGRLNKTVKKLVSGMHLAVLPVQLQEVKKTLEGDFLIHQLKNHLVTLTYAANAKLNKLRIFMNPNLVRLHDFESRRGQTYWDYNGELKKGSALSRFHLSGGLNRLDIALSPKWENQLFRENLIFNFHHVQALMVNVMRLFPLPRVEEAVTYTGMLTQLGYKLLSRCPEDDSVAQLIERWVPLLLSGYHYRKAMAYVAGQAEEHNLFFSELCRLGEAIYSQGQTPELSEFEELTHAYGDPSKRIRLEQQRENFGNIYFHTFGSLNPRNLNLIPQELAWYFSSGWLSGNLAEEFKVKLAHHMYKKGVPATLMGQVLMAYMESGARQFLRQSHKNDYFITQLVFDIFNNSHMQKEIKQLQKRGYLKLQ